MQGPFFRGAGGVLSADIAVPDHQREVEFYSSVLTTGRTPLWRDDLTNNQGTPVIGLRARSPEYDALPVQWMPHVQVADVDASAAHALECGGTELLHATDDDARRQWSVLVDPDGAAFGVIPAVTADSNGGTNSSETPDLTGSANQGGIGRITGLSLVVRDVPSISEFYQHVAGWSPAPPDTHGRVEMSAPNGIAAASILPATGDHDGLPSTWILSLPVNDLAESLRQVRERGGEVVIEPTPGHAIIRDPVGVHIALQSEP